MSIARMVRQGTIGALYQGNGTCSFSVWNPLAGSMSVKITAPEARAIRLQPDSRGYWKGTADGLLPGCRYVYRINDDKERPDPASRSQPEGVHGPSELTDPGRFAWNDGGWRGIPLRDFVIYELHIGTFTPEGTFSAALSRLDYLKELGITAVEIMPVAQFPGDRNWGYDGVYPFAPQNTYGGPAGLKELVNACHRKGLAVILDVVYNHLGPDGNYLHDFGPYFTGKYKTPWGDAVNYDGAYSDEVRNYFIENALYWVTEFHMDGLRLDAIDTIYDFSPRHFLAELAEAVHRRADELERQVFVIAESDLNDVRVINPAELGGFGIDAQWSDDFHHSLHSVLTGERKGYYQDFGTLRHLEKAFREGFVNSGTYSPYRKRRHGSSSRDVDPRRFIVCSQNHDQVGNRMLGERLSSLVTFEQSKLAAACVILSPFIPLLFMGEEYGETAPFQYFVSHVDLPLIKAVREGRTLEFAHFEWAGDVPDPQDEQTFLRSKIHPELRTSGRHRILFDYYKTLLGLRRSLPALRDVSRGAFEVRARESEQVLLLRTQQGSRDVLILHCFGDRPVSFPASLPGGAWRKLLDSSAPRWGGGGERARQELLSAGNGVTIEMNPRSSVLYGQEGGR